MKGEQKITVSRGCDMLFERFWNLYALKRDRIGAERAWKRLSAKDRRAAIDGIAAYREACQRQGISMMYGQGYLSHRRWEDEDGQTPQPPSGGETAGEHTGTAASSLPLKGVGGSPSPSVPQGYRMPNSQEMSALEDFRLALQMKQQAKPFRWQEFQRDIVAHLAIPFVNERTGGVYLCVERDGKRERITDYMIDYYDSYADFYSLLGQHFDVGKIIADVQG